MPQMENKKWAHDWSAQTCRRVFEGDGQQRPCDPHRRVDGKNVKGSQMELPNPLYAPPLCVPMLPPPSALS